MIDNMLSKINFIGDWAIRLAYLNFLWILFSVMGLFLLGIFPATAAMFTVIRKWMLKEQVSVFHTFKKSYRKEFTDANILGWLLLLIGIFIYIDFVFLTVMNGIIFTILLFVLISVTFIYLSIVLYIFPVFVHFKLKKLEYVKYAFIISLSYPHHTILMLLGTIVLIAVFITFPMLFPFIVVSSFGCLTMYISKRVFQKV
ncbi:YesL family protein [Metabacillus bambusae]|uniref:DUF624 domain-containing protein n=1 Tax=Metabacillus bambusae TaxID=2795218 RepID=A0ABS3MZD5_9BACI|nr:DUF624 domain-containing protein [Metabacillus bambusae]MBO1511180.1 DUF624 domain-containing protein [Metabacillus bambusae]